MAVPAISFAVLGMALVSVLQMTQIKSEMDQAYDSLSIDHDKQSKEDLATVIQIELLVGGILGFSTFLYQAVCAFASLKLHSLLAAKSKEEEQWDVESGKLNIRRNNSNQKRRSFQINLSFSDKLIVAFSLLTSFLHIYVSGTFVLFATNTSDKSWMLAIWRFMGRYDSRYTNSDPFLVSSSGFLAFVVGPLLLAYIWTIVNKHPVRQVCGIITYSLEIYTYILYFAIAIHSRGLISVDDNPTMFVLLFLGLNLFRGLIPCWIVSKEVQSVLERTRGGYQPLPEWPSGETSKTESHLSDEDVTASSSANAMHREVFVQCDPMEILSPHFSRNRHSSEEGVVSLRSRSRKC